MLKKYLDVSPVSHLRIPSSPFFLSPTHISLSHSRPHPHWATTSLSPLHPQSTLHPRPFLFILNQPSTPPVSHLSASAPLTSYAPHTDLPSPPSSSPLPCPSSPYSLSFPHVHSLPCSLCSTLLPLPSPHSLATHLHPVSSRLVFTIPPHAPPPSPSSPQCFRPGHTMTSDSLSRTASRCRQ